MKSTEEKVRFLQAFSETLAQPTFTNDRNAKLFSDIRSYTLNMLKVFQHQLQEENNQKWTNNNQKSEQATTINSKSSASLPKLSNNFSNIDEDVVRKAILSWHNDERNSLGLNLYTYNIDLEGSATTRANQLSDSGKTNKLHVRNPWDWTYSYNSLISRFSDLWIEFPASVWWAASFSESIWYGYYKCSSSDCTQNLIDAVKKTRTWLIMKEKSYNWTHYKAATMKHFTQMWAWIAIDKSNNRYYMVLHYWVEF